MTFRPPLRPILLLLLLGGSCDRQPSENTAVFRFINRGDIFTLDLNEMSYAQDIRVTYLIREGLYSPTGPQSTPKPAGATGCDVSADQLTYTFHLRPDAKWSNGDPVTADDYVFSWRYMLQQPGEYTNLFYYVRGAEAYKTDFADAKHPSFDTVGIKAIDATTLQVTLAQPTTYFLDLVAFTPFYPRNERSMAKFIDSTDPKTGLVSYNSHYTRPPDLVGNGPFVLTDWKFKRGLRMTRSANYWDAAHVHLDEVDMLVNDNVLSTYLQFSAKAVDWVVSVPPEIGPDLRDKKVPGFVTSPSFGTEFLTVNCKPDYVPPGTAAGTKNPFADVRVRQAFAMAVDKESITKQITRMGEKPATHYIPPGTIPGFENLPALEHDEKRAQALLAEAGYPQGRGFPNLSILFGTENKTRERIAQVLKQQWKQALGVTVEIEPVEGKSFTHRVTNREFSIAMVAWYGDYLDVSTFTDKYASTSLQNDATWIEPRYDALLNQAAAETNVPKRLRLLSQAEQLLNTEAPIVPLYHYVNVTLIGPRVKGIEPNPRGIIDWKAVTVQDAAAVSSTASSSATP